MLDTLAHCRVENVEQYLACDEEEHTKGNVSKRPPILQCTYYKQNLHD